VLRHDVDKQRFRRLKMSYEEMQYDDGCAIGRRYRRQDEIGTPFCITVDGQTKEDSTVTLRDRDSLEQVRVPLAGVLDNLRGKLKPSC